MSHPRAYNFKPVTHYQFKSYRLWNAMKDANTGKGMKPHTSNCVCVCVCVCVVFVSPMYIKVLTNGAIRSIHFWGFFFDHATEAIWSSYYRYPSLPMRKSWWTMKTFSRPYTETYSSPAESELSFGKEVTCIQQIHLPIRYKIVLTSHQIEYQTSIGHIVIK